MNLIATCRTCGLLFDNPRPSTAEIRAFYSTRGLYSDWLAELKGRDLLWRRRLRLVLNFKRAGELLDIGAGIGQFLHFARAYFRVVGTEISSEAIAIAKERYGIELLQCHPGLLEQQGSHFDVITLFHVLEHLPNPGETLALCWRLLSPDGILVIAVPNESAMRRAAMKRGANSLLGRLGIRGFSVEPPLQRISLDPAANREIHLSHFTPRVLKGALHRAGFVVLANSLDSYFTSVGFRLLYRQLDYAFWRALNTAARHNFYETILMVGKKP